MGTVVRDYSGGFQAALVSTVPFINDPEVAESLAV
jgi:hypothetical protein